MKIYWTKKSIPELKSLTPTQRKRNYRDAAKLATTHMEYWVGVGIFVLMVFILTMTFAKIFPGHATFPYDVLQAVITAVPSVLVLKQFEIYAMRKHYRHILMKTE